MFWGFVLYHYILQLIALNASDIPHFINQKAAKMSKKLSHETFRMN